MLIVGVWAVIAGLAEIAAAFGADEPAGTRAMFILAGLATAAFGVVLCARPGIGAVTLALLFPVHVAGPGCSPARARPAAMPQVRSFGRRTSAVRPSRSPAGQARADAGAVRRQQPRQRP